MVLVPGNKSQSTTTETQIVIVEDQHWSPSLRTVLEHPPSTLPLRLAIGGTVFCLAFGAWAWFGQVNEVARATGKLIPKGGVYKVHPIESGKVVTVAVKEGQTVKTGDILMELDTEIVAKDVERLQQLLPAARTELKQTQLQLAQARLQLRSQDAVTQALMGTQAVAVTQAKETTAKNQELLAQLQSDAEAQQIRLKRLKPLVEAGAISQENLFAGEQQLRDRQRSITESQESLQKALADAERSEIGLAQKRAEAQQSQLELQQQIQQLEAKVTELQSKANETQVSLDTAKAKLKQHFLYAPVNGIVLALNTRKAGEVVEPEQPVAEIAPQGQPLVLSAILPSQEAGFVKTGMPVQVKFDAYPYQDYGIVSGQVTTISSDSKPDERLGQVYRVEIDLTHSDVSARGQSFPFKAGQTASAEIVTRHRRIIDVLLDPLKKLRGGISL